MVRSKQQDFVSAHEASFLDDRVWLIVLRDTLDDFTSPF